MSYEPSIGDVVTDTYDNGEGTVVALFSRKGAYEGQSRFWVLFNKDLDYPLHCERGTLEFVRTSTNDEIVWALANWRKTATYKGGNF